MRTDPVTLSWPALAGAAAFVLLSGAVSAGEGTFASTRVTMDFVHHAGMWSDLLILPVVVGVIVPGIPFRTLPTRAVAVTVGVALAATMAAHQQWASIGALLRVTDHVFPDHTTGRWYADISAAGWLHVIYMTGILAVMIAYALLPLSRARVLIVAVLLTLHLPLGMIQPGWYTTGELWRARILAPPAALIAAIWIVARIKCARGVRRDPVAGSRSASHRQ